MHGMKHPRKKQRKQAAAKRAHIPADVEVEVLQRCKRHCCMCYGLNGTLKVVDGQIAHLGRDPSSIAIEDLAYLCLECHKKYDTINNRVLSFRAKEILFYRASLYKALRLEQTEWTLLIRANNKHRDKVKAVVQQVHEMLRKCCDDVTLNEGPLE
jgi:hypothetical protein